MGRRAVLCVLFPYVHMSNCGGAGRYEFIQLFCEIPILLGLNAIFSIF
jgi:hypothetical protein